MRAETFGPTTATAVVVANMIGTGVFTSLGFQLLDIQSTFVLLMLWLVGGVAALCGALTYAELGAALPRSGGEYNFLTAIYHPLLGFVSGWISATIGFAAPTALAAISFGTYLSSVFPGLSATWLAAGLVLVVGLVHTSSRRSSGQLQNGFTALKLILIAIFCVAAVVMVEAPQSITVLPVAGDGELLLSGAFAVSLIYVNYAYTGWNAATYLSSELAAPERHLPKVLIIGTGIVVVTYLALNYVFLYVAPMAAMAGKIEIGYVAASHAFAETGASLMGITLSLLLVSTVSAMVLAGPRVLHVIGQDFRAFRLLGVTNRSGVPAAAILTQTTLSLVLIATSSFQLILVAAGFILGVNSFLTVAGIFVLRARRPQLERPFRTPLYPLTPLVYLGLTGWTLIYIAIDRPMEALIGLVVLLAGVVFYLVTRRLGEVSRAY